VEDQAYIRETHRSDLVYSTLNLSIKLKQHYLKILMKQVRYRSRQTVTYSELIGKSELKGAKS